MTQEELNTLLEKVALDVQDIRRITGGWTRHCICTMQKWKVSCGKSG